MDTGRPIQLVLGSLEIGAALGPLGPSRVLFVPTAANGLADRDAIVEAYRSQVEGLGIDIVDWDIDDLPAGAEPPVVDAVVCSGGDPYHLLAACRRSGFDRTLAGLVDDGVVYVGASAGALVAGPSLDPIERVTPFERPADLDGAGLRLTDLLVLPHDDRAGRRVAHASAQATHGAAHRMLAITDTETVGVRGGEWHLTDHDTGRRIRPAAADDAETIADCFVAAGRQAWGFADADRFAAMEPPVEAWIDRIASLEDRDDLLVVDDADGVAGFVWVRRAADPDLDESVGEVGSLYTLPRVWGGGAGRRLLTLGLDRLRARGCREAVLYTEERNARPRQLYERLGWRTDGASRDRDFLGDPIRELRYRLVL